jgi:hypothetical protein
LDREGVTSVPIHRQALAATMRDGAAAILGMNLTDKQYSEIKDEPLDVLNGASFRKFMIDMSEVFVKGVYSGRTFGVGLCTRAIKFGGTRFHRF